MKNKINFSKTIFLSLSHLYYKNNNILEDFWNLDVNNNKDLLDYYYSKDFKLFLRFSEKIDNKLLIIAKKIENNESKYVQLFKNLIIEEWSLFQIEPDVITKLKDMEYHSTFTENLKKITDSYDLLFVLNTLSYFIYEDNVELSSSFNSCIKQLYTCEMFLNDVFKSDNILEEKLYKRYKEKRLKELYEFIGVRDSKEFYDLFEHLFTIINADIEHNYVDNELNMFNESLTKEKKIFKNDDLLHKFGSKIKIDILYSAMSPIYNSLNYYCNQYAYISNDIFKDIFNKSLDIMLLSHLKNIVINSKIDFNLSMIVRQTEIKNYEAFISSLFGNIFSNYLLNYSTTIIEPYMNIDDDLVDNCNDKIQVIESNYLKQLNDKDKIILNKEEENKKLLSQLLNKDSVLQKLELDKKKAIKGIEDKYLNELNYLKKQVEFYKKENEKLKSDTMELNEIRECMLKQDCLEDEEEFSIENIDLSIFKDKRYIFIGGRFELLKKLEEIFPKSKFYHTKPKNSIDISKVDEIIIFPKNINHPMYWDAIELAKNNKIPFMFTLGTNLETVIHDIVKQL